jgi:hypothetical protein
VLELPHPGFKKLRQTSGISTFTKHALHPERESGMVRERVVKLGILPLDIAPDTNVELF